RLFRKQIVSRNARGHRALRGGRIATEPCHPHCSDPPYNDLMTDFIDQQRDALARHLRRHLAGEVRFDTGARKLYSTDASIYQIEPLGVVLPRSSDDLVAAVQIAGEMRVPITARGGGTSL